MVGLDSTFRPRFSSAGTDELWFENFVSILNWCLGKKMKIISKKKNWLGVLDLLRFGFDDEMIFVIYP